MCCDTKCFCLKMLRWEYWKSSETRYIKNMLYGLNNLISPSHTYAYLCLHVVVHSTLCIFKGYSVQWIYQLHASKEEQLSTLPTINGSSGMEANVSRYIGLVSAVAEVLPQQAVSPPMNTWTTCSSSQGTTQNCQKRNKEMKEAGTQRHRLAKAKDKKLC